jgi:hypothetical protein
MLSHQLITMIEDHWEQITTEVINNIRTDPLLPVTSGLPFHELEVWGRTLAKNMGHWLSDSSAEIGAEYESIGRKRFAAGIPLSECVHALHLLKNKMLDFVRSRGFAASTIEIYAEEELEHRVGKFFDNLTYHLVHGYETAMKHSAAFSAHK